MTNLTIADTREAFLADLRFISKPAARCAETYWSARISGGG